MLKKIVILFAVAGCGEEIPPGEVATPTSAYEKGYQPIQENDVWVCYNPGHPLHGEACMEVVDRHRGNYQPCFWTHEGAHTEQGTRSPDAFCWLLKKEDCDISRKLEWQKENCHFFE